MTDGCQWACRGQETCNVRRCRTTAPSRVYADRPAGEPADGRFPSAQGGRAVTLVADLVAVDRSVAAADLVGDKDRAVVSRVSRAREFQDDRDLREAEDPPFLGRGHAGLDLVVVSAQRLAEPGEDLLRAGRARGCQRAVADQV